MDFNRSFDHKKNLAVASIFFNPRAGTSLVLKHCAMLELECATRVIFNTEF